MQMVLGARLGRTNGSEARKLSVRKEVMKLASIRITNFQSIRDSNICQIGDITCLVGKNEAGKTAMLQALHRLNPMVESAGKFDVTDDYPRKDVENYKYQLEIGKVLPARVVAATFNLEDDDLQPIRQELGTDAIAEAQLTLYKGYDNKLAFALKTNLRGALANLIKDEVLPNETRSALSNCSTVEAALEVINGQKQQTPETKSLKEVLSQIQSSSLDQYIYDKFLAQRIPKFLYFDEYYQMKGQANIEGLIKRRSNGSLEPSDYPMIGLIELARLKLDDLLNPTRTQELKNKIEGAGNYLSERILKYWSQNKHLDMSFDVRPAGPGDPEGMRSGTNIWVEIYDARHKVTTGAGTRSRGFVCFFSFLAWYSRVKREDQPLILLLDEPGLSLHAKAQEYLLRYFEQEVKGVNQLIYTTHSPFMVDPRHLERVRIVQDKGVDSMESIPPEEDGTKVLADVFEGSADSIFPLQAAICYEMYQSMFVGNTLVVEGVADLLYLQIVSTLLEKQGRTGLSPQWTITPVGGSDKVATLAALIGARREARVASLIDIRKNGGQAVGNLYQGELLRKNHMLTFAQFAGKLEADVEDMFDENFFLDLVNAEFRANLQKPVAIADLDGGIPRINVRLETYFQANPMRNAVSYSHYRPARYFSEKATSLESRISKETFDRFEAAVKALNALLEC